ncbi:MAG: ferredoxin [bacterium]|nr:ferredoxin [bacterium]
MEKDVRQILAELTVDGACLNLCHVCLKAAPQNLAKGPIGVVPTAPPTSPEQLEALYEARRLCPAEAIRIKPLTATELKDKP